MKRNGLTSFLFTGVPPETNFTAGRWSWITDDTAKEYEKSGYGREWNPDKKEPESYPAHVGGGWYELSNGEKVKGKEEAELKESELNAS
jgi:hypothetical protein